MSVSAIIVGMDTQRQYAEFSQPFWAPPSWIFGPVWTVLYVIILFSFVAVFYESINQQIPWQVALPFGLNLVFNFAFTPIQFGLRSNWLASIDIVLIVATLVWALIAVWPYMSWVVYANTPYLLWGLFATGLQLTITYLNK